MSAWEPAASALPARVENRRESCRAPHRRKPFDAIAHRPEFSDHLGRPSLCAVLGDGWAAFLMRDALMQQLPDQAAQPMRDGPNGLGVSEAWDQSAIHQLEDTPFVLTAAFAA